MHNKSFFGVKQSGRGIDHPGPSSTEIKVQGLAEIPDFFAKQL
jgi:hypothetical protein